MPVNREKSNATTSVIQKAGEGFPFPLMNNKNNFLLYSFSFRGCLGGINRNRDGAYCPVSKESDYNAQGAII